MLHAHIPRDSGDTRRYTNNLRARGSTNQGLVGVAFSNHVTQVRRVNRQNTSMDDTIGVVRLGMPG